MEESLISMQDYDHISTACSDVRSNPSKWPELIKA
jgi:hypothetical protein